MIRAQWTLRRIFVVLTGIALILAWLTHTERQQNNQADLMASFKSRGGHAEFSPIDKGIWRYFPHALRPTLCNVTLKDCPVDEQDFVRLDRAGARIISLNLEGTSLSDAPPKENPFHVSLHSRNDSCHSHNHVASRLARCTGGGKLGPLAFSPNLGGGSDPGLAGAECIALIGKTAEAISANTFGPQTHRQWHLATATAPPAKIERIRRFDEAEQGCSKYPG